MASTQIGKKFSEELIKDVSKLLGRGKLAFPCPLTADERVALWNNMIRPDILAAYELLLAEEVAGSDYLGHWNIKFKTTHGNERFLVEFVHQSPDPQTFLRVRPNDSNNQHFRSADSVYDAMPGGKHEAFTDWMRNCAMIRRDFEPALQTLKDIIKFCGTIGQLTRAIPDLHKYLKKQHQDILREQTRSSNMPYEWASFDRARVDQLQFAVAKSYLLPAQTSTWEDIYMTGATFAP
jgi:hypothetical protein